MLTTNKYPVWETSMKIIKGHNVPIKLWLDDIEDGALQQAFNLSALPFVFKWVAIMPDAHQGYGMPIGGVLATKGVVIPNAVGVDIGCGVCALRTSLKDIDSDRLKDILSLIRQKVPLGFRHHKKVQVWEGFERAPDTPVIQQELKSAQYQLGTLGGGNHFIEIQKGSDGHIWVMIHSGSRNFGLKIANFYHKKALAICENNNESLPHKDLAFLKLSSKQAKNYLDSMNFALDFARENRFRMLKTIKDIILETIADVDFDEIINIHHNYAALEKHYGQEVVIHRKGATSARLGELGIIPGSQGTNSYIVQGKGNQESFMSCSHGAGRKMGRKQAQRELNLDQEKRKLDDAGVLHAIRGKSDLDEAPGAYKNIEDVMENQKDLVDIKVKLRPLAVIKG